MDRVFIENLTVETVIGIFDWEREIRQAVSLDLEMDFDIRRAAASDSIEDTLDYKAVSKRLIHFVEQSEFQLVESLAETDDPFGEPREQDVSVLFADLIGFTKLCSDLPADRVFALLRKFHGQMARTVFSPRWSTCTTATPEGAC